jgi:ADP-ribose pyrophosphatase YjhB (NUDIX family)
LTLPPGHLPSHIRIKDGDTWLPERLYAEHLRHFPVLTVDLVVTSRDRMFLLVKRSGSNLNWKGVWATPGGRVFRNERIDEAACRVLLRETGIMVPPDRFKFCGVEEVFTSKEHGVTMVNSASTSRLTLTTDRSSSSARWFGPDSFPSTLKAEYRSILEKGGVKLRYRAARARGASAGRAPS